MAIAAMIDLGFENIGLTKICAGVYENNLASARVLVKNKFVLEGRRVSQYVFENRRIDALLFARRKDS